MNLTRRLGDETDTARFGAALARALRPTDRIGLVGDLGAGKTTLARAVLRTLAGEPALEVPSPTYTLVQSYPFALPVRHADLYRVRDAAEIDELGLGEGEAAELIEWPHADLPLTAAITLDFADNGDARTATVAGDAAFLARLSRQVAIADFLARTPFASAERIPLVQDASARNYERLRLAGGTAILMDAPPSVREPDGYPARAGLWHGNIDAFLAVGARLAEAGVRVPSAKASDEAAGLLVLTDFGDETIAPGGQPDPQRYGVAIDLLAHLHARLGGPPDQLSRGHTPARFNAVLAAVEVGEFCHWALDRPDLAAEFGALWGEIIDGLDRSDDTLALRDYHSPNLLWQEGAQGIEQIGVIDYQDAMIAPAAYDVASLIDDARVTLPPSLRASLLARYVAARPAADTAAFARAVRVLSAQRITKILGIFRRLDRRDGKSQYLAHLPRNEARLRVHLAEEPALETVRAFLRRVAPALADAS